MEIMTHSTPSDISVHIQSDACRCYSLMSYHDITVKPSDFFMKLTLSDIGIQSTNNRVDFSNIFMQITGQPIHFFDADTISGSITVRQAHE
jgi:phenylalanyl-tRNA synthetase beta chain